jgi:hypothetical protein
MAKKVKRILKERTRNGFTETEAMHMGKIRSALRGLTRFGWVPKKMALQAALVVVPVGNKKINHYRCAICNGLHRAKDVEVDHMVPAGTLRNYGDLPEFCRRLFVEEPELLRVLCEPCHKAVTLDQRTKICK